MSPRPDVSEIRKTQILEAAANVFLTRGIVHTRMDDIVAESGLSKGTLYWYFKSKDDIIIGLVQQLIDSELDQINQFINEDWHSATECLNHTIGPVPAGCGAAEAGGAVTVIIIAVGHTAEAVCFLPNEMTVGSNFLNDKFIGLIG